MWRQEHADADLEDVPSDLVMASGSGLDPHITLENAMYQLDRVASAWAKDTGRDPAQVQRDIEQLLQQNASAPFGGGRRAPHTARSSASTQFACGLLPGPLDSILRVRSRGAAISDGGVDTHGDQSSILKHLNPNL